MRTGRVAGIEARVLRAGFVSSLGFEIHVPYSQGARLWEALMTRGAALGLRAFGVEAQRVLRLEKGHAIIAQDTDNLTDPFEAGLGFAVRRDKPFFVGKRSLEILEKRGARQKLVGFALADDAPVLESHLLIHDGDIAGRVTSVARSPTLGRTIGLAMAAPALSAPGTRLSIRVGDVMVAAQVVRTPFVEGH
jgi:sarcosine oxidase subunit alpha